MYPHGSDFQIQVMNSIATRNIAAEFYRLFSIETNAIFLRIVLFTRPNYHGLQCTLSILVVTLMLLVFLCKYESVLKKDIVKKRGKRT